MRHPIRCCVWIAWLTIARTAGAQVEEPPTITTTSIERTVSADVGADGACVPGIDETSSAGAGSWPASAFVSCMGRYGSRGTGSAEQLSQISSFSISGTGSVLGDAMVGGDENARVVLNVYSLVQVSFSVSSDTPFELKGDFAVTEVDLSATCETDTGTWVFFAGTDTNGANIQLNQRFNCLSPPEDETFFLAGTLRADTPVTLLVMASSGLGTELDVPAFGQRTASFDFRFDLGDRDGDGLLDKWEIEGIDVDGDGQPEIDLPAEGADPDKKDLFVEVDVMNNVFFDQEAVDDVVRAFAEAPASAVDNPDGSPGIQLHVLLDGDRPSHQALVQEAGGGLPAWYYVAKSIYFGSDQDRDHPAWDDIRQARLQVFRYCLWADTFETNTGRFISGIAEAIPSNDFLVAAGRIDTWYSLPRDSTNALAGTFMHELGHTLNLRHGGGEENSPNYKPNYLSVMNYTYQLPWTRTTQQGTNGREAWKLDFSRMALESLDESELVETDGLHGPQGRKILFNSSAAGSPSVTTIGWATSPDIDWNNSGVGIPPETAPYALNITKLDSSDGPCCDALNSYTDWDRIWYHLAGNHHFDDRIPWPFSSPAQIGIDEEAFFSILNSEWVDQTALGDLIFANDFDLGSTTAWSMTVP